MSGLTAGEPAKGADREAYLEELGAHLLGQAELTIDLAAVAANWRFLQARIEPAECAGVVKADAYGLGIEAIGPALWGAGCRTFFVALPAEGLALRAILPEAAIYILDGLPEAAAPLYAHGRLRPVLGNLDELDEWTSFCRMEGRLPAALHVDTGMNRLGLRPDEANELTPEMLAAAGIDLLMSHFVSAEQPDDAATSRQRETFARVRGRFPDVRASLSNSAGIFLEGGTDDLVRPGYALYGGNPTPSAPNPMQAAVTLTAPVLQVRTVEPGESVGYNERWRASRHSRIAVIGVGYADGFLRSGSGEDGQPGGFGVIGGQRCPFVGRISMDLITLDVTAVPLVRRGDMVELIGPDNPIDLVGTGLGTSGYEVLTNLSRRCRRSYRSSAR